MQRSNITSTKRRGGVGWDQRLVTIKKNFFHAKSASLRMLEMPKIA